MHELGNWARREQTELDSQMDEINNDPGVNAPDLRTWEDVVGWARGKISEAAAHNGDGEHGRVFWWKKTEPEWRPDWSDVPVAPLQRGGAEHRYDAPENDDGSSFWLKAAGLSLDAVDDETEDEIARLMASPAYWQTDHPDRARTHARVRGLFERAHGTEPVARDVAGRQIAGRSDGNCPVDVRAHAREGGKVRVEAHCRSMPA